LLQKMWKVKSIWKNQIDLKNQIKNRFYFFWYSMLGNFEFEFSNLFSGFSGFRYVFEDPDHIFHISDHFIGNGQGENLKKKSNRFLIWLSQIDLINQIDLIYFDLIFYWIRSKRVKICRNFFSFENPENALFWPFCDV